MTLIYLTLKLVLITYFNPSNLRMTLIYLTLKHAFNDIVIVNLENDFNLPNSQTNSFVTTSLINLRMTLIYLTLKLIAFRV